MTSFDSLTVFSFFHIRNRLVFFYHFRLSYFERKCVFLTNSQLQSEVISHYSLQAIRQAYVLLLGLDVIGNPFGLVVGIGQGVEAFFYEPIQVSNRLNNFFLSLLFIIYFYFYFHRALFRDHLTLQQVSL